MKFENLRIIEPILKALAEEGYKAPTPIQEQAIPHALEGKDILGCAQTGTGKTAAFAIPIIQNIHGQGNKGSSRKIQSLILTPTRELAVQIEESFKTYGRYTNLKYCTVYGGVSQKPQTEKLRRGVDVLVATPGRLIDLINQRQVNLSNVSMFVLDEADRMLDMGFIHDVKKIISCIPKKRQTQFFSATMPKEITELVNSIVVNPVKVSVTPASSTVDKIKQSVYFVDKANKKKLLVYLLKNKNIDSALVFTRTKHEADKVEKELKANKITAQAIHGDKSQSARQMALNNFKSGKIKVLVATDIAARGIDIDELSHVINYNLPNISETYIHRIGRTGRAGLGGTSISFCEYEEKEYLNNIQKLIKKTIPTVEENPYPMLITSIISKNGKAQRDNRSKKSELEKAWINKNSFLKKSSKKSYSKYASERYQ
ncbi:MAG: DEAD/DEAH box helicase [Tissierellia bacterium]|nr:DEAD/DEAH box helicase [Tissierellia bacterium]MDD3226751.1 DEAD/DEAH box helicase [Tissierellia bacterium]MDD3751206.1 DEAD/DEAH box helicase [Tissierellia bacterium]MDD4046169.1 DEAD/DEAH box helicase [Tissierellia bacterium]MDD4679064.1 DEAD/DEAH box helicase [Tissierellia bacterium]